MGRFQIVHPFHPLRGREYELVIRRRNWGQDRVFFYDSAGMLKSFPASITDVVPVDSFVRISGGRSAFRIEDLLELRELLSRCDGCSGGLRDV